MGKLTEEAEENPKDNQKLINMKDKKGNISYLFIFWAEVMYFVSLEGKLNLKKVRRKLARLQYFSAFPFPNGREKQCRIEIEAFSKLTTDQIKATNKWLAKRIHYSTLDVN